jgi:transcriptional regulator with XRE-family HTH domain
MNDLAKQIGTRIYQIREETKMLQVDLAHAAQLTVRTVGRIERGEVDVRLSTLYKIAKALNVEIKDLLTN